LGENIIQSEVLGLVLWIRHSNMICVVAFFSHASA